MIFYNDKLLETFWNQIDKFDQIDSIFKNENEIKVDIAKKNDQYVLDFILPGFKKELINIEVDEEKQKLFVSGKRLKDINLKYDLLNSYFGSFKKEYIIPKDYDCKNIISKYEDGILELIIERKKDEQKLTTIKIE